MKPNNALLAVHKTFDKGEDGKRAVTWNVYDGETLTQYNPKTLVKFIENLQPGQIIRFTAVNALDVQLQELLSRGIVVMYSHWHSLGIAKDLSAEELIKAYFVADATKFRTFVPRPDIARLRDIVSVRNALVEQAKASILRVRQAGRNNTVTDEDDDSALAEALDMVNKIHAGFKTPNAKGKLVSYDTRIAELAKAIPECMVFNKIVGFKDWGTAAAVVSVSGGFDRFPMVASVWKFYGLTKDSKRKKGQTINWTPRGKCALYLMMESIMKNTKNPWRAEVDRIHEAELAVHEQKHPGCKAPNGHSWNMAKMKVKKEIMKRFFLVLKGEKYNGQLPRVTLAHRAVASL